MIYYIAHKDNETNRHIEYNSLYLCYPIKASYEINRIKAVLAEKGISQTWLAKQLNKSFSMQHG